MNGDIDSVNHLGIAVRDMDAASALYEQLGFVLTPLSVHSGADKPGEPAGLIFSRMITHEVFLRPALEMALRASEAGSTTYFYSFDWKPEGSPFKSCHCLELPFVFGLSDAWARSPMLGVAHSDDLSRVSDIVQNAWLSFVRSGTPEAADMPEWQAFNGETPCVMHLNEAPHIADVGDSAP